MRRGLRVASRNDAAIIALLKECIANARDRRSYEQAAARAYISDTEHYRRMLERYFGRRVARSWHKRLTTGGDTREFRRLSRRTKWALRWTTTGRQPFSAIASTILCCWKRLGRLLRPPGFVLAVLGTDGSGKSTIIRGVGPVMEASLHKKPVYEHLRPNLLPSIARLLGRPRRVGPVTDPHASEVSGVWGSLARLVYYSIDYVLGYWLKVHPAKVKRQNIIVFDRYYYDYLIDPHRSRIRLPGWVIRAVGTIIPRPDLILCLGAAACTIHARKPELPLEEVRRQVEALRQFCDRNKRAVWIDTGCSVQESVNEAIEAITSRMAARYE